MALGVNVIFINFLVQPFLKETLKYDMAEEIILRKEQALKTENFVKALLSVRFYV